MESESETIDSLRERIADLEATNRLLQAQTNSVYQERRQLSAEAVARSAEAMATVPALREKADTLEDTLDLIRQVLAGERVCDDPEHEYSRAHRHCVRPVHRHRLRRLLLKKGGAKIALALLDRLENEGEGEAEQPSSDEVDPARHAERGDREQDAGHDE